MKYTEGPSAAEDAALERWIDRTMDSVDWHEERAEALGWEEPMGYGQSEAFGYAMARELREERARREREAARELEEDREELEEGRTGAPDDSEFLPPDWK